jgi:carbon starvation protein
MVRPYGLQKRASHMTFSILAVIIMYITIIIGSWTPIKMPSFFGWSPQALWVIILLIYAYTASILPVQVLLQPRDYINSH